MLLGGPWQPSDGPDPGNNPNALINTAIRTIKEQTDVDLSACNQWSRFFELHYLRSEPEVRSHTHSHTPKKKLRHRALTPQNNNR